MRYIVSLFLCFITFQVCAGAAEFARLAEEFQGLQGQFTTATTNHAAAQQRAIDAENARVAAETALAAEAGLRAAADTARLAAVTDRDAEQRRAVALAVSLATSEADINSAKGVFAGVLATPARALPLTDQAQELLRINAQKSAARQLASAAQQSAVASLTAAEANLWAQTLELQQSRRNAALFSAEKQRIRDEAQAQLEEKNRAAEAMAARMAALEARLAAAERLAATAVAGAAAIEQAAVLQQDLATTRAQATAAERAATEAQARASQADTDAREAVERENAIAATLAQVQLKAAQTPELRGRIKTLESLLNEKEAALHALQTQRDAQAADLDVARADLATARAEAAAKGAEAQVRITALETTVADKEAALKAATADYAAQEKDFKTQLKEVQAQLQEVTNERDINTRHLASAKKNQELTTQQLNELQANMQKVMDQHTAVLVAKNAEMERRLTVAQQEARLAHETAIKEFEVSYNQRLAQAEGKYQEAVTALRKDQTRELEALKQSYAADKESLRQEYEKALADCKVECNTALFTMEQTYKEKLAAEKAKQTKLAAENLALQGLKAESDRLRVEMKESMSRVQAQQADILSAEHTNAIAELQAQHSEEADALKEAIAAQELHHEKAMEELKEKSEKFKETIAESLKNAAASKDEAKKVKHEHQILVAANAVLGRNLETQERKLQELEETRTAKALLEKKLTAEQGVTRKLQFDNTALRSNLSEEKEKSTAQAIKLDEADVALKTLKVQLESYQAALVSVSAMIDDMASSEYGQDPMAPSATTGFMADKALLDPIEVFERVQSYYSRMIGELKKELHAYEEEVRSYEASAEAIGRSVGISASTRPRDASELFGQVIGQMAIERGILSAQLALERISVGKLQAAADESRGRENELEKRINGGLGVPVVGDGASDDDSNVTGFDELPADQKDRAIDGAADDQRSYVTGYSELVGSEGGAVPQQAVDGDSVATGFNLLPRSTRNGGSGSHVSTTIFSPAPSLVSPAVAKVSATPRDKLVTGDMPDDTSNVTGVDGLPSSVKIALLTAGSVDLGQLAVSDENAPPTY